MKRFFINKNFSLGFCLSLVVLVMAVTCFFWTPYNANSMNHAHKLQGPSPAHPFGTDAFGMDVFSRVVHGARVPYLAQGNSRF